jgi:DNA-directed RNA polymerase subunit RPC12/RpoP
MGKQYKCECGSFEFETDNTTLQKGYVIMTCKKCGKKYVRKLKQQKCSWCGKGYYALDWYEPSSCPHCHHSFVD